MPRRKKGTVCSCGSAAVSRGLCGKHYKYSVCSFPKCLRGARAGGFCSKHYMQERRKAVKSDLPVEVFLYSPSLNESSCYSGSDIDYSDKETGGMESSCNSPVYDPVLVEGE